MTAPALDEWMKDRRSRVEVALERWLPREDAPPARLSAAMRYAVLGPGKKLRPLCCLMAAAAGALSNWSASLWRFPPLAKTRPVNCTSPIWRVASCIEWRSDHSIHSSRSPTTLKRRSLRGASHCPGCGGT